MQVIVHENNVDKALKELKRRVQRDGLLRDLKKKSFYLKPSEKEKEKQRAARRKRLKAQRFRSAGSAARSKRA
ncbi:MAG: 30S ribosomal protein S21 [Nitrospirota bacterium]